ncbi:NUDIX domain-containing protein [Gordonia jinhuaensis]|uniref:MutT/NUDIX-family protein n=1 Tax=Gordonia jinhuaensis TaxID=1517702 RepID=A0A916T8U0_9ACTN|nr:NUDIX domain-containing protein [Gordonia jinhuaensis]GGB35041.1 putative MutT/NUDIX-family protein [Gordonia jinhuaensis]
MATPEFILELREKVGHAPLWLSGVTAVVVREGDTDIPEILMVRRADNHEWTPVTGIIDPGEEPAVAAAREVAEETSVIATAQALTLVHVIPEVVYPNGDRTRYLDLVFRMQWHSGEPVVNDDESVDTGWFPADALPPVSESMAERISSALAEPGPARFREA